MLPAARDFIADASAHRKFIAYSADAMPLLEKAGATLDEGFVPLNAGSDAETFVKTCRKLRFWDRVGAER
jgi:catalase